MLSQALRDESTIGDKSIFSKSTAGIDRKKGRSFKLLRCKTDEQG